MAKMFVYISLVSDRKKQGIASKDFYEINLVCFFLPQF